MYRSYEEEKEYRERLEEELLARQLEFEREREQYEEQQRIHEEENRLYDEQCDWERQQEDLRIIEEAEMAERILEIERQEKQEMDDYYESFIEVPEETLNVFNSEQPISEEDLFNFIQKDERGE